MLAPPNFLVFFFFFSYIKKKLITRVEWYVARTNQIDASGYVSRISYIATFGYLTPITEENENVGLIRL